MATRRNHGKSQSIRLLDVFVLGPWLIWLGARDTAALTQRERTLLTLAGAATVGYNARNYLRISSQRR